MAGKIIKRATKLLLISCNTLAALGLVMGCYGSKWNSSIGWVTGLFTLSAFYFLLALLLFLGIWLFIRPKYALISLLAVLTCWLPLREVLKIRINSDFNLQKSPDAIRVMSWNVEHFKILQHKKNPGIKTKMLETINTLQPDIACFQEMVAAEDNPKAINNLPDFIRILQLPYYHYAYNPRLDFDARHHFGVIIFSRYPIVNAATVAPAPKDYNSIYAYADIVKNNDTFRVFTIHLQSLKFSKDNKAYLKDPTLNDETDLVESKNVLAKLRTGFIRRERQSNHIAASIAASPYPVIVCGDFNDVPNSYAYRKIGTDLQNAFAEQGAGIGSTFDGISPTLRIDNIFADKGFSILQYQRYRKKLSDHFPIVADLQWQKTGVK